MTKLIDLTGLRFSRLVVIGRGQRTAGGQTTWLCKCDCGNEVTAQAANIKNGATRSCGCIRKEQLSVFNTNTKTKHNLCKTSEYRIWGGMLTRCLNKNTQEYHNYGGRGINVCERWKSFENFLFDMGKRPSKNHSIDRIDVDGNYSKENCRWATFKEQCYNKRGTVYIEHKGEKKTICELAEMYSLPYRIIWCRLKYGKVGGSLFRPITPLGQRTKYYDIAPNGEK